MNPTEYGLKRFRNSKRIEAFFADPFFKIRNEMQRVRNALDSHTVSRCRLFHKAEIT